MKNGSVDNFLWSGDGRSFLPVLAKLLLPFFDAFTALLRLAAISLWLAEWLLDAIAPDPNADPAISRR